MRRQAHRPEHARAVAPRQVGLGEAEDGGGPPPGIANAAQSVEGHEAVGEGFGDRGAELPQLRVLDGQAEVLQDEREEGAKIGVLRPGGQVGFAGAGRPQQQEPAEEALRQTDRLQPKVAVRGGQARMSNVGQPGEPVLRDAPP